jgi:DNA-binding MarR family transcriptional regulator
MDRPTEVGAKLTVTQSRMLQRIPDEGLAQIALRQGRGNNTAAQTRTLHILIQWGLVVEPQSENGEVRYELTDAGRRLAGAEALSG